MPTPRRNTRSPRTLRRTALTGLLFTGAITAATVAGPALAAHAATPASAPVSVVADGADAGGVHRKPTAVPAGLPTVAGLDAEQSANAATIIKVGKKMHAGKRAEAIAVATAMQESKLYNLDEAVDHDSLGLFQQRPASGWGSPAELTDPVYAANAFYKVLVQDTSDYSSLTQAAQRVQVSAYPDAYAQWETLATTAVNTLHKY
jgi:hypothetical protein